MKKIMIAVFALVSAASMAQAQEMKINFDGDTGNQGLRLAVNEISSSDASVPAPGIPARENAYKRYPDNGSTNVYETGAKCIGGDCVDGWPGYACNLKTCGKKSVNTERTAKNKTENISDIISALDSSKKLKFYESLTFREGKLTGAYTKDVANELGERAVNAVLNILGAGKSNSEKGFTETDYIKDYKCLSPANCTSANGYTCTENC